jgi:glyoxylase-like metal-dependent hydrolase (beta-lactamase superfamily II)
LKAVISEVATYFDRMSFGDATVTLIASVRGWRFRPPYTVSDDELQAAAADADASGRLQLDHTSAHIATGDLSIVIDPGRVNDEQRQRYAPAEITPGVDGALAKLGIEPAAVTHVVVTHHHHDHFTGITREEAGRTVTFPNARHLITRLDWEGVGIHDDLMRRHWQPVAEAGLVDLVIGDHELGPGVHLLPLPGETAGHQGLRLESRGEAFYWVGDLIHHDVEVSHLDWALRGALQPAMEQSRRALLEAATDTGAVVAWAHAPFPGWGRVGRDERGFTWTRIQ